MLSSCIKRSMNHHSEPQVCPRVQDLIHEGAAFLCFAVKWRVTDLGYQAAAYCNSPWRWEYVFWRISLLFIYSLNLFNANQWYFFCWETWAGRSSKCCSSTSPPTGVRRLHSLMEGITFMTSSKWWRLSLSGAEICGIFGLLMHKSRHAHFFNLFLLCAGKPWKTWMQPHPWWAQHPEILWASHSFLTWWS